MGGPFAHIYNEMLTFGEVRRPHHFRYEVWPLGSGGPGGPGGARFLCNNVHMGAHLIFIDLQASIFH